MGDQSDDGGLCRRRYRWRGLGYLASGPVNGWRSILRNLRAFIAFEAAFSGIALALMGMVR